MSKFIFGVKINPLDGIPMILNYNKCLVYADENETFIFLYKMKL